MLYFHAMLKKYDISTNMDVLPKCPKIGISVGSLLKTKQHEEHCNINASKLHIRKYRIFHYLK